MLLFPHSAEMTYTAKQAWIKLLKLCLSSLGSVLRGGCGEADPGNVKILQTSFSPPEWDKGRGKALNDINGSQI